LIIDIAMKWTFDSAKLAVLRKDKGMTQEAFSARIGTQKQHLSSLEHGATMPNVRTLLKICNVFDIEPSYFFAHCYHRLDDSCKERER